MLQSPEYYRQLRLDDEIIEEVLDFIFTAMIKKEKYEFLFYSNKSFLFPKDIANVIQTEKLKYVMDRPNKVADILRSKKFDVQTRIDREYEEWDHRTGRINKIVIFEYKVIL